MHSLPALTLELLALIQTDRPAALAYHAGAVPRVAELIRDVRGRQAGTGGTGGRF